MFLKAGASSSVEAYAVLAFACGNDYVRDFCPHVGKRAIIDAFLDNLTLFRTAFSASEPSLPSTKVWHRPETRSPRLRLSPSRHD